MSMPFDLKGIIVEDSTLHYESKSPAGFKGKDYLEKEIRRYRDLQKDNTITCTKGRTITCYCFCCMGKKARELEVQLKGR